MKYQKPSKPCARKRRNKTRLQQATGRTQTGRRTRYVRRFIDLSDLDLSEKADG